jgi:hypothetical protein
MPLIDPEFFAFMARENRVPSVDDTPRPWTYKGWLLYYVQLAHMFSIGGIPDRWGYLGRTIKAGHLLSEPIPKIKFHNDPKTYAQIKRWVDIVRASHGCSSALSTFCEWLGWALGVNERAPNLDGRVLERLYREVTIEPLLLHPYDYLGNLAMENNYGKAGGFFPTPQEIADAMVLMTMADDNSNGIDIRTQTVCDPCVGTGRMLLSASNYSLRLYGQDISGFVLLIANINFALYAPWAVAPLPESFFSTESASFEPVLEEAAVV